MVQTQEDPFTDLRELNIPWVGRMTGWREIPLEIFPYSDFLGRVYTSDKKYICKMEAVKDIDKGTYGIIEEYKKIEPGKPVTHVIVKRQKEDVFILKYEALFQWYLYKQFESAGYEKFIPRVYDIYRIRGKVGFSMEKFVPLKLVDYIMKLIPLGVLDNNKKFLPFLLLQIAIILDILHQFKTNHRDLKVDNMIVVQEEIRLRIPNTEKMVKFPFRIVIIDFGWACYDSFLDVKSIEGLPPLIACPNEGVDMLQVLVSLWKLTPFREKIPPIYAKWIVELIECGRTEKTKSFIELLNMYPDFSWLNTLTSEKNFSAPKCVPRVVIDQCLDFLT